VPYGIRATVIVVGGGNSAGQTAVFPSEMASHVHVIVRGGSLAATMSNEGTSVSEQLIRQLRTSGLGARVDRVVVIHVDASN
jgi:thioredoxin reductase